MRFRHFAKYRPIKHLQYNIEKLNGETPITWNGNNFIIGRIVTDMNDSRHAICLDLEGKVGKVLYRLMYLLCNNRHDSMRYVSFETSMSKRPLNAYVLS